MGLAENMISLSQPCVSLHRATANLPHNYDQHGEDHEGALHPCTVAVILGAFCGGSLPQ